MVFKEAYTDDDLIGILVDRAGELGKTPTVKEMNGFGAPYTSLYQRRFASHKGANDGWNNALMRAGLKTNRRLPDQNDERCAECGCDGNTDNGKLIRWMGTNKIVCIKHYQQLHYKHRTEVV